MRFSDFKAGDIVVTNFSGYQHWSIVTDAFCSKGKPKLISATRRNGTVREEPWDQVTNGKYTYVARICYQRSVSEVLKYARSEINTWKYSVSSKNCEHFAKWAAGIEVTSTQVVAGVSGVVAGATLVGLCSDNPKAMKLLGGAAIFGGLAVLAARAMEEKRYIE